MIKESVYECIGNTPLVKLQHLPNATNSTKIYGKIEYINPGLSSQPLKTTQNIDL
ncbi:hypothetical protein [uncultured Gammaproteobacteria bacterium]|uniref:Cysteine synthase n=1 Tax=Bathymodiolus azoricus thioautotrophic gill symbiont TaxID=235205 RepID=A0A1H6JW44_9GAMM|nr:hypothetical protein [Bathymodiolus azoricus thioautotrophic gill symbiont]CAC9497892.1 hypothetical protein [uncultured Gammaproteobacteria bacterium]SEH66794.1 hypothetical protein BAZSYMA_ACONTIG168351_0 [Bathymodiolus azoricus thioautotrophic gill symbiont]